MIILTIDRDKRVFGTYRGVTERFCKHTYRIKNGEVQVRHAGKWWEIAERNERLTDSLRAQFAAWGHEYKDVLVVKVF